MQGSGEVDGQWVCACAPSTFSIAVPTGETCNSIILAFCITMPRPNRARVRSLSLLHVNTDMPRSSLPEGAISYSTAHAGGTIMLLRTWFGQHNRA